MGSVGPPVDPIWYWFDPVSELQKRFDVNDPLFDYIQAWLMPTADMQLVDLNSWCVQTAPDTSPLTAADFESNAYITKLTNFAKVWAAYDHCPGGEFSGA